MYRFNPFNKPIRELGPSDLSALRTVSEGWYVEYKREVPNVQSVAKSVSAFANHYGGWLFYGVEESADGCHYAGAFPGIPEADLPSIQQRLQDAAKAHINPPPYFEHVVLLGPEAMIGLAAGRIVVTVHVPPGGSPPYMHSSGRIYRRICDSSDPRSETDRTVLDILWQRGREQRSRLARFLETDFRRRTKLDESAWVHVFIMPDPLGDRGMRSKLGFPGFATTMHETGDGLSISLQNSFAMSDGYVARHFGGEDYRAHLLTWRYYSNCTSVVSIPVRASATAFDRADAKEFLARYEFVEQVFGSGNDVVELPAIMDLNQMFFVLAAIMEKARRIMQLEGHTGPLWLKARTEGTYGKTPYLDMQTFATFVSKHAMPLVHEFEAFAPPGVEPATLFELPGLAALPKSGEELLDRQLADTVPIFAEICACMGLPLTVLRDGARELFAASQRASAP